MKSKSADTIEAVLLILFILLLVGGSFGLVSRKIAAIEFLSFLLFLPPTPELCRPDKHAIISISMLNFVVYTRILLPVFVKPYGELFSTRFNQFDGTLLMSAASITFIITSLYYTNILYKYLSTVTEETIELTGKLLKNLIMSYITYIFYYIITAFIYFYLYDLKSINQSWFIVCLVAVVSISVITTWNSLAKATKKRLKITK